MRSGEYNPVLPDDHNSSSKKTIKTRFIVPKGWNEELYRMMTSMRDHEDTAELERRISRFQAENPDVSTLTFQEIWDKKKEFFDAMANEYKTALEELDVLRSELKKLDNLPVVQKLKSIGTAADLERSHIEVDFLPLSRSERNLQSSLEKIEGDVDGYTHQLVALEAAKPGIWARLKDRTALQTWQTGCANMKHKIKESKALIAEKKLELARVQKTIEETQANIKRVRAEQNRQEDDVRATTEFKEYQKRYDSQEDAIQELRQRVFGGESEEDYYDFINTAEWLEQHFDVDQPRWFDSVSPPRFQSSDREESVREILRRMRSNTPS